MHDLVLITVSSVAGYLIGSMYHNAIAAITLDDIVIGLRNALRVLSQPPSQPPRWARPLIDLIERYRR